MIVVFGGLKGGIGKSTLAVNMAVMAARAGRSVLLVDADAQETSMTWARARAETLHEQPGAIPTPAAVTTVAVTGRQIRDELMRLRDRFEVIVVDAGARDTASQRAALSVADKALLPFPPRGPDLWTIDVVAKLIEEIRTINPALRACAFVNQADPREEDNAEAEAAFAEHAPILEAARLDVEEEAGGGSFPVRIQGRKAIANAVLKGLAAAEATHAKTSPVRPDPKAISELETLYRYIFHT